MTSCSLVYVYRHAIKTRYLRQSSRMVDAAGSSETSVHRHEDPNCPVSDVLTALGSCQLPVFRVRSAGTLAV